MQKIVSSTATANSNSEFTEGSPAAGVAATLITAAWLNSVQRELVGLVEGAGLSLSAANDNQLLAAVKVIMRQQIGMYAGDTGAVNAFAAAYNPAVSSLTDGLVLRFKAGNANTGASSFIPGATTAVSAKPIVGLFLNDLQGGEIQAGSLCTVVYSATLDAWVLLSATGGALQVAPATKSRHAVNLSQLLQGTGLTTPAQFDNSTKMSTTEFVQRAIGNFSFSQQLTAAAVLGPGYCGQNIWCSGSSSYTVTLPSVGTVSTGSVLYFWSSNPTTITVTATGTDNIFTKSTSTKTLTLGEGDSLYLVSNPAIGWIAFGGSKQLGGSASFMSSSGVNGYQKLPSGLIEVRGKFTASATAGAATPVTFPLGLTTVHSLVITPDSSSGSTVSAWYDSFTGAGFNGHCNLASTACTYIAKGL